MGQLEDLIARRNTVAANIEKACNTGFDLNEELEKARSGVYADTAENRKMNRVGQKYGSEKKEEEPKGQREKKQEEEGSGKTVSEHAAGASDEALKRAAADDKASPEVKAAAEEEMKKRGSEKKEEKKEEKNKEDKAKEKDLAEYAVGDAIRIKGVGTFMKVSRSEWVDYDPNTKRKGSKRYNYTEISDNGYAKNVTDIKN